MSDREQGFTLADFLRLLRRRSVVVVGCAIILGVFLTAVALASHPVYEARGSFQIITEGGAISLLSEFFAAGGGSPQITSEIEIVRSRSIAEAVIAECDLRLSVEDVTHGGPFTRAVMFVLSDRLQRGLRGLRVDPVEFPPDSVDKSFFLTFTDETGGFRVSGPQGDLGGGRQSEPFQSEALSFTATMVKGPVGTRFRLKPRDAYQTLLSYRERLKVSTLGGGAGRSNLIQIAYSASEPSLASDVVNAVINEYERRSLEWKSSQGQAQTEQIEAQLAVALQSLQDAEAALEQYKNIHGVVALPDEARLAVADLAERETERIDLNLRLSILQQIHRRLAASIRNDEFAVPPTLTADPVIERLTSDHARLTMELGNLLIDYTESHPAVIAKREAIRGVRESILEVLGATVGGLINQRADLDGVIAELEQKLYSIPGVERELLELTRDQEVADEAYRLLVRRRGEARLLESSLTMGNRVVDQATPPARPVAPSIRRNLAFGLVLGLVLGIFLAFLLEVFDPYIRRPEELEGLLNGAPLAVVRSPDPDEVSRAAGVLALASIRTDGGALALLGPGPDTPSARAHLERTIASLAASVQPILMVDTRSGARKSALFDVSVAPGLSEIAQGQEVAPQVLGDGLTRVLPPGAFPSSAHVSSARVRERIAALQKDAALTLIYAPNLAAEPALRGWANIAGGAVLVLVRNRDIHSNAIAACEALKSDGVPILAALLLD